MKRPCLAPKCPALIDALPNRLYCDRHADEYYAKHPNLEVEYEGDAEGLMERLLETAVQLGRGKGKDYSWERYIGEQIDLYVPALRAAAYSGEIWTAVSHALQLGLMAGHAVDAPDIKDLLALKPDAALGKKWRAGQRQRRRDSAQWVRDNRWQSIRSDLEGRMKRDPKKTKRRHLLDMAAEPGSLSIRQLYTITKGIE